jgi:hypothetical protein
METWGTWKLLLKLSMANLVMATVSHAMPDDYVLGKDNS